MSDVESQVELVSVTFYDATAFVDGVERLVTSRDGALPEIVELHDLTSRGPGSASSVRWYVLAFAEDEAPFYARVPRPEQLLVREEGA